MEFTAAQDGLRGGIVRPCKVDVPIAHDDADDGRRAAPRNTWVQLQPIHIDWSEEVAHCDRLISDALRNISARMSEVHQAESIHITTLDGLI